MQSFYLLLTLLIAAASAKKPSNAILLSSVKTLTLRGDQKTTARRVKAIPQLKCVGGNAKGLYEVDVMRCKNSGSEYDAEDISWTCQASLPSEFKLGSTDVICEGYANADDPYVLKGSCGVEYRLSLTDKGEAVYGNGGWPSRKSGMASESVSSTFFTIIFWAIFGGIVLLLAYKFVQGLGNGMNQNRRPRRPFGGFGGGGGGFPGGGDDNDPPPPYTRRPPKSYSQPTASRPQQGWRPGFFSGAAAGAAAGYAMGSRGPSRNPAAQAGPSGWFNTGARNPVTIAGPSTPSQPSSSSGPRYESSGFGGTRRR